MSLIRRYFPRFGPPFLVTLVFVACESMCDLLQPTLLAHVIDRGIAAKRWDEILHYAGLMLLVTGLGAIFALLRNFIASKTSQDCGAQIRSDLFTRLMARPVDRAALDNPDTILTRLTNDVNQVQAFLNGSMRVFFKAPILAVGAMIMAVSLDPNLSYVLLIVVPIALLILGLSVGRGWKAFQKVQEGLDKVNGAFREFLAGIRVVKAFDRGPAEVVRFSETADNLGSANTTALQLMARVGPLAGLVVNFGVVVALAWGAGALGGGAVPAGHLVAFVNYMTQVLFALLLAANIITAFVRARASASRVQELFLLDVEPSLTGTTKLPLPAAAVGVEVTDLQFSWPRSRGRPVIDSVSFCVRPGEFVGVLGATGSGKSTLLALLAGFQKPSEGSVLLNGIAPYGPAGQSVRDAIGYVPQRVNLFTGTVKSNVLWGNPNATPQQLDQAAQASAALHFITSFPDGWETTVGRGGVTLSGGQKQRLSLARALVRQPGILFLDDSLSAVDSVTEEQIRLALLAWKPVPTIILVAQRIGSVVACDRVLVLDEGRVAGFDTPERLKVDCEVYREIVRSQTGLEADHV